jgi:hypothetical protein
MLVHMPDVLILTLTTGEKVYLEVDDARADLKKFQNRHAPYHDEWIEVSEQQVVRRGALVSVQISSGETAD